MKTKPVTVRTWKTGNGLVVTIPKALVEAFDIKPKQQLRIILMDGEKDAVNKGKRGDKPK